MNRLFDKIPVVGKLFTGKIILSMLMVIFAFVLFLIYRTTDRAFCIFAMFFSFLGDAILNRKSAPFWEERLDFIIGGLSFICAFIFYGICYSIKIINHGFKYFNDGAVIAIIVVLLTTILFSIKTFGYPRPSSFKFGLIYLWVTGISYSIIFSYAISIKSIESLAMLGGFLFFISDVIIGLERFTDFKSKFARELVWWLYPLGQILLIVMA